jgi:hypothetical protein
MRVFAEHFAPLKIAHTGGTILHPLLSSIASNFDRDDFGDAFLRLLILFESTLISRGVLPSDYVFCLARRGSERG